VEALLSFMNRDLLASPDRSVRHIYFHFASLLYSPTAAVVTLYLTQYGRPIIFIFKAICSNTKWKDARASDSLGACRTVFATEQVCSCKSPTLMA